MIFDCWCYIVGAGSIMFFCILLRKLQFTANAAPLLSDQFPRQTYMHINRF